MLFLSHYAINLWTSHNRATPLFQEHTGRVFRLQFDEFQIVSSSHDDTILIWDFLNCDPLEGSTAEALPSHSQPGENRTPSRKYNI